MQQSTSSLEHPFAFSLSPGGLSCIVTQLKLHQNFDRAFALVASVILRGRHLPSNINVNESSNIDNPPINVYISPRLLVHVSLCITKKCKETQDV